MALHLAKHELSETPPDPVVSSSHKEGKIYRFSRVDVKPGELNIHMRLREALGRQVTAIVIVIYYQRHG